jgi:predicted RNase H-like nuclease (RuvC/YqgF family)
MRNKEQNKPGKKRSSNKPSVGHTIQKLKSRIRMLEAMNQGLKDACKELREENESLKRQLNGM